VIARELDAENNPLHFITPYHVGGMSVSEAAPEVSPIQAYFDLYASGGLALKKAEYLLNNWIPRNGEPRDCWIQTERGRPPIPAQVSTPDRDN
jgi:hypothetical protein